MCQDAEVVVKDTKAVLQDQINMVFSGTRYNQHLKT
jgi:hypothetical protein